MPPPDVLQDGCKVAGLPGVVAARQAVGFAAAAAKIHEPGTVTAGRERLGAQNLAHTGRDLGAVGEDVVFQAGAVGDRDL